MMRLVGAVRCESGTVKDVAAHGDSGDSGDSGW
jgi:hypothetical protein